MSGEVILQDRNAYVVQLTSLRGIACMVVLIGHVIQVVNYRYPSAGWLLGGVRNLVTGAFNAEGAVLVFFVLSGCVLSLSLRGTAGLDRRAMLAFYVKRVFRLYPLLWVSLLLAAISMLVGTAFAGRQVFSPWLDGNILSGISGKHSLLSATGFYTRYNGPMWSLRVELICSALFPAIYALVADKRFRAGTLCFCVILLLLPVAHRYGTAFGLSFAVGALIPMLPYRQRRLDVMLVLAACLALIYDRLALAHWNPPERYFDLIETAAAFVIVRDIFTAGRRYRFLLNPAIVTLGEISFSVYLLHLPIFIILFSISGHLLGVDDLLTHPLATQISLIAVTTAVTVGLAIFTYRMVELPMHEMGRRLAKRIRAGEGALKPGVPKAGLTKAETPLA